MKKDKLPQFFKTREQYIVSALLAYAVAWGVFFLFGYNFFDSFLLVIFLTIFFTTFAILYLFLSTHQIIFSDFYFISQSFLRIHYIQWEEIISVHVQKMPNPFLFGMLGEYVIIKFNKKNPKTIHVNVSHINHENEMIRELDNLLIRHSLGKKHESLNPKF